MSFPGFDASDFAVFSIPDFSDRIVAVREQLRPKLLALSAALAQRLSDASGHILYPHVAQHAMRRTNPPEDTWAAFARSQRGYQRYAHLAIGLQASGAYVRLVLKAGSDDKKHASTAIAHHGTDLLSGLTDHPHCFWYDSDHPETGTPAAAVTDAELMLTAARLEQRKTASMATGFELPRAECVSGGEPFLALALARCLDLLPLYEALTGEVPVSRASG